MTIIGIAGQIGSGKSFYQLKYALKLADERQKQLVTNFTLDLPELYKYVCLPIWLDTWWFNFGLVLFEFYKLKEFFLCSLFNRSYRPPNPRHPWLKEQFDKGCGLAMIPNPNNLQALFIPESIVCLDEAGVFLNSREFINTPKALLADLAQSRKDGIDLVWCAQFDEQVDKQFRLLTQFWVHCQSLALYNKKARRPEIKWKLFRWFTADSYQEWRHRSDLRNRMLLTRFRFAAWQEEGFLTKGDLQLFKCFNSMARLDTSRYRSFISTIWQCPINIGIISKRRYEAQMLADQASGRLDLFNLHPLTKNSSSSDIPVRSIQSNSRFKKYR